MKIKSSQKALLRGFLFVNIAQNVIVVQHDDIIVDRIA